MFEEYLKKLAEELKSDLPGFSAQKSMAPLGRKPPSEYIKKNIIPKKSAVLILLYPQPDSLEVKTVLMLRPEHEGGNHGGQISFPGGGMNESDKDLSETALREAEEEIGVKRSTVSIVGALSPLYIPVSNYMVHPYVGACKNTPQFIIHPLEVKALIEVGLEELSSDKNKTSVEKYVKIKGERIQVPCYNINGEIIWGATAMIISEFAEIIRRITPLSVSPQRREK